MNCRSIICAVAIFLSAAGPTRALYDSSAGKPAARPLPTYCQMGECFVQTVEATDPIAFASDAVLLRVESQNWHSTTGGDHLKREADSSSFVLCSKKSPAVVDEVDEHKYMVTFVVPNDASAYNHANETALALYFTVCHARAFGQNLFEQGPAFAASLGYAVKERDDQPTIPRPEDVFQFLK